MPHALLEDPKAILAKFVASKVGEIKAMAITYAYQKLDEILEKLRNYCPPLAELEKLTKVLTTLKSLIQKYDNQVSKLEPLPDKLTPAIVAGKAIVEILSHMPLPSTIGTPPGPAGGVIISVPVGVIQAQANTLVWARKGVELLSTEQKNIGSILSDASGILDPIKARIAQLEALLQRCVQLQIEAARAAAANAANRTAGGSGTTGDAGAQQIALSTEELNRILKNLTGLDGGLSIGDDLGESYVGRNGREYTLFVIKDPNSPEVAPRRQAIAKDFRGIVVLKGPLSFAGSSKVLKDELKLRIDNQLP